MASKAEKVKKIRESLARLGRYARARDKVLSVLAARMERERELIRNIEKGAW